jgi:hypothetical protein
LRTRWLLEGAESRALRHRTLISNTKRNCNKETSASCFFGKDREYREMRKGQGMKKQSSRVLCEADSLENSLSDPEGDTGNRARNQPTERSRAQR